MQSLLALAFLAALAIALLILLDRARRGTERLVLDLEKRHRDERTQLADRIQHPELIPIRPTRTEPRPPKEPKDQKAFAQVGTVVRIHNNDDDKPPGDEAS